MNICEFKFSNLSHVGEINNLLKSEGFTTSIRENRKEKNKKYTISVFKNENVIEKIKRSR